MFFISHLGVEFLVHMGSMWVHCIISMVNLLRNCEIVFQNGCIISYPHQRLWGSDFSASSPALVIVWLFDYSHPGGHEVQAAVLPDIA